MNWSPAFHPGQPLQPHDLWSAWNGEWTVFLSLAILVFLYLRGVRAVWQRAGRGRAVSGRKILLFSLAALSLLAALVSPLDALSNALFSAHMVQHLLLILAAAPLLVLSDLPLALLWALPRRQAQAFGKRIHRLPALAGAWKLFTHPVTAWLLFTAVMWVWHAPRLYEAALREETVHAVEHLNLLAAAFLFWWVLLRRTRSNAAGSGMAVPYLFATLMQSGILGALMTFTSKPWYSYYSAEITVPWGLSPLQDQQLAGVIMWIPGGAVFTLLTILYFGFWLRALERRGPEEELPIITKQ